MSFTALNNPENHPARSMQDTFYVDMTDAEGRPLNLRPHTSPMQVRYARMHAEKMRRRPPPSRGVAARMATVRPHRHQGDRAGAHLSRRQRRDALADVPSGRRPVARRAHLVRGPEGRVHRVPRGVLRDRCTVGPFPSVVLPVHRAVGGDRHALRHRPARRPLARDLRGRARCIRRSSRTSGSIRDATSASRSAAASSVSRCSATASTTCACSTKATCGSSNNSNEVRVGVATVRSRRATAMHRRRPMQLSESWLRSFVDPRLSTDELAHELTMRGLEVETSVRSRRRSPASSSARCSRSRAIRTPIASRSARCASTTPDRR